MTGTRILQHVNIMVDDLETATAFYRDVIGLELDKTPPLDFPAQFFKLGKGAQIHMNEFKDERPFRAHFCLVVDDFNEVFRRLKTAGVIDNDPWGKVRRLPAGSMQMFARDPAGNLVEIASRPGDEIDQDILSDELVEVSHDNDYFKSGRNDPRRGD
ncbi:VOC family protein [Rhodovibrionaceae bacterium A322]